MEIPFNYSSPVTGKYFIGRKKEVVILSNLLSQGESVTIYSPPKTGKNSLLQQSLLKMKTSGKAFSFCEFSLTNIRSIGDFATGLAASIIRSLATTPDEYEEFIRKYLSGTHFVFDPEQFESKGSILSLNWDIDFDDVRAVLSLPYRLSSERNGNLIITIHDFQNILLAENGDRLCRTFDSVMKEYANKLCSFVFLGSEVNAMKEIFVHHGYFHKTVSRLEMEDIDVREVIDFAVSGFLTSGKVVDRDLMLGICNLFHGNIWYISHFCSICDSLSKGYIMEPVLIESLNTLMSVHEPAFKSAMNGLTTFQVCLLRAVLEGNTRFSSSEVIQKYGLNSSANVRRLKDALCKKEIITFDDKDSPRILDPLFEYWLSKKYFNIK